MLLLLTLFVCGTLAADWTYNRCDTATGPSAWGGQCKSTQNTPINLCNGQPFAAGSKPTFNLSSGWFDARNVKIFNNGYTVQIDIVDNVPTLQVGNLAYTVGRGTNNSNHLWVLAQMHVHFGRWGKLDEGSEHYMQGQAFPLEAHLVHYNAAVGSSVAMAASSGRPEALLVVGVFFQLGTDNDLMNKVASGVSIASKTPTYLANTVAMSQLFNGQGEYYSYAGGLTTPNCQQQVTWIVMKNPKTITEETLNKFKKATASPSAQKFNPQAAATLIQGDYGTYRPLQAVNSRTVYSSDGNTAGCTTVTEPAWYCSAGLLSSPSIFLTIVALSLYICHL